MLKRCQLQDFLESKCFAILVFILLTAKAPNYTRLAREPLKSEEWSWEELSIKNMLAMLLDWVGQETDE
jgi:hypothetical protein